MLDSTMDAFLEKRKKRAEQRHEEEQHRDVAAAEAAKSDSERRKEAEEKMRAEWAIMFGQQEQRTAAHAKRIAEQNKTASGYAVS